MTWKYAMLLPLQDTMGPLCSPTADARRCVLYATEVKQLYKALAFGYKRARTRFVASKQNGRRVMRIQTGFDYDPAAWALLLAGVVGVGAITWLALSI